MKNGEVMLLNPWLKALVVVVVVVGKILLAELDDDE